MAKPGDTVDNIYGSNVDTFKPTGSTAPDSIKNKNYYPQIHVNESTGVIEKIEIKEPGILGLDTEVGEYVPNDEGSYDWVPVMGKNNAYFAEFAETEEGQAEIMGYTRSTLLSDVMTNGTKNSNGTPLSTDKAGEFVKTAFTDSDQVQKDIKEEEDTVFGTIPTSANDPNTNPSGGSPNATNTRTNFTQGGKPLTYPVNLDINTQSKYLENLTSSLNISDNNSFGKETQMYLNNSNIELLIENMSNKILLK